MKRLTYLCLVAFVSSFVIVGCEKKEEAPKLPDAPKAPEVPKVPAPPK